MGHFQGKTCFSESSSDFALQEELDKQRQDFPRDQVLLSFWGRLAHVHSLVFQAKTCSKDKNAGWQARGAGEVNSVLQGEELLFTERGIWKGKEKLEVTFHNIFRWGLDCKLGVVSLEHLRRGINHPVFLFHLAPTGNRALTSVGCHLCGSDSYFGRIVFDEKCIQLSWRVIGSKKNERVDYVYT